MLFGREGDVFFVFVVGLRVSDFFCNFAFGIDSYMGIINANFFNVGAVFLRYILGDNSNGR